MSRVARISAFIADAASWAAIGEVFGTLAAVTIPQAFAAKEKFGVIGALVGIALAAVLTQNRQADIVRLLKLLSTADALFILGFIDEQELSQMRSECIRKHI